MMIVASRPLGTWGFAAGRGAESFEDGSLLDRAALTVLICIACLVLARRPTLRRVGSKRHFWLLALFGFLALSIFWSDYPAVSLKRWIRLLGAVPIAFLVATERDPLAAITKMLRRVCYILIPFSWLLINYYPSLGRGYSRWSGVLMWHGVTLTKNALGQLCLMTIVVLVWSAIRQSASGRKVQPALFITDASVVLLAAYLMVGAPSGAYSATSTAVLVIVLGGMLALFRHRSLAPRIALLLFVGALVGWVGMIFTESFVSQASLWLGRDETLTGRTEIWEMALTDASAHPILGAGFGGYFNTNNEFTATYGNTGHNGLLDVYVETGAVGVLILLVFLCSTFGVIRKVLATNVEAGAFAMSILLMNVLANFTESLFLKSSSYLWTMLLVMAVLVRSSYTAASGRAHVRARTSLPMRGWPGLTQPHRAHTAPKRHITQPLAVQNARLGARFRAAPSPRAQRAHNPNLC
jgi:exopolysaccharide production protein ExoQ